MFTSKEEKINNFVLREIVMDEVRDFPLDGCDYIRVKTPARYEFQDDLEKKGFFRADRMLKVSINLRHIDPEIDKKIRQQVVPTTENKDEIFAIAKKSFPVDRRFHIAREYDDELAASVIRHRMEEIEEYFVVLYKDMPIGFAGISEIEEKVFEIKLAAVDEKYRMIGAAVSLYNFLVKEYASRGGKQLIGWISTVNCPVMNLYSALGAAFSEPSDIFLKKV